MIFILLGILIFQWLFMAYTGLIQPHLNILGHNVKIKCICYMWKRNVLCFLCIQFMWFPFGFFWHGFNRFIPCMEKMWKIFPCWRMVPRCKLHVPIWKGCEKFSMLIHGFHMLYSKYGKSVENFSNVNLNQN